MPDVVPFVAVAALIIIAPGADMALVLRNTLRGGTRSGLNTVAGVLTGVLVHGAAAVLGLSALIATSATAFQVVKIAGAIYLVVLGLQTLLAAYQGRIPATSEPTEASGYGSKARTPFAEGLITNVLNPKLAVLFLSLMPQFVNQQAAVTPQVLLLSVLFALLGAIWLVAYVLILERARRQFERPAVRRTLDAVSGSVLVALGLRLVADRS